MNARIADPSHRRCLLTLVGCCLMQGGSLGIVMNTMGLFFTAVSQDMGFSAGGISLYKTIAGLSSCLLLPFAGKLLYSVDTRITLTLCAGVMGLCTMLMGVFRELWQWYTAAFLLGIASAMLLSATEPIILANWFREKLGLAIGISAAFSGVMGMLGNLALERFIAAFGWRAGYFAAGGACLAMLLPATLSLVRLKPEMVGCKPCGSPAGEEASALPEPRAMTSRQKAVIIALLCAAAACPQFCVGFSAQIVNYCVAMGKSMALGAVLVSCSMIANAGGKVLLGEVNDAHGTKWACVCGFLFSVPAFLLLLLPSTTAMIVGTLCYGAAMSLSVITPPLLTRKFFRSWDYPKTFSLVMTLSTLVSSFSTGILGLMYDRSGSYRTAIGLCMALCAAFLGFCGLLLAILRTLRLSETQTAHM